MSTLSLFDYVAASAPSGPGGGGGGDDRLDRLLEALVQSALLQYEQIEAYDRSIRPDDPYDRREAELVRETYREWATFAEQVLNRIDVAKRLRGTDVPGADKLGHAYGRTMAMLSVTLEDIERGIEQVRNGQVTSAEDARRELRARLQR